MVPTYLLLRNEILGIFIFLSQELWVILDTHTTPPPCGDEQMMDYTNFKIVSALVRFVFSGRGRY